MSASMYFEHHGRKIAEFPRLTIILSFAAVLLACPGLFFVKVITNPEHVWVPSDSRISKQKTFFDKAFTPFFRINQAIFTSIADGDNPESQNLISSSHIQRLMDIQRSITNSVTSLPGLDSNITLSSLCFKPIDGQGCLIESPAQFWFSDPVILATDPVPALTAACQTSHPMLKEKLPCFDEIGTPVLRHVVFGGLGSDLSITSPDPCGDKVPTASALFLTILLNNHNDAEFQAKARHWEKDVFIRTINLADRLLRNDIQTPMRISYMAGRSVQDSLETEAKENSWIVLLSYLTMFVYVSLALGRPFDRIRSRYKLALVGLFIVISSFITAISILSLIGVQTTLIVWEVIPFLALAIGVDNMFIITREFDRIGDDISENLYVDVELKIGSALANSGPSILAAGLCEVIIFALGALTNIPALRQFCIVASTTVLINLCFQLTWFVAALSLDARRVQNQQPEFKFFKSPSISPDIHAPVRDRKFISKFYLPFLLSKFGQGLCGLIMVTLFVCGIIGSKRLPLGLEPQLAAPVNSHLQAYYNDQFGLGEAGPPAYIVLTDIDYYLVMTNDTRKQQVTDLMTGISQITDYVDSPLYSWIDSMTSWVNQRDSLGGSCPSQVDIDSPEAFITMLELFLSISITSQCCQSHGICGAQFKTDIQIVDGSVQASRIRFNMKPLVTQRDFVNSFWYMQQVVDILANQIEESYPGQRSIGGVGNLAFVYSIYMVYYEQYLRIQAVAIQGVLLSIGVVFLAILCCSDLRTASIVTFLAFCMTVEIIGLLWIWSALDTSAPFPTSINAVSVCNLIMGIGLSVEFLLHVAQSYVSGNGTRCQRVEKCMISVGSGVFMGITLTKLVGIAVLAVAPSRLFRLYYFRMYICIVFVGAFLGLAVLPLALAKIGSLPSVEYVYINRHDSDGVRLADKLIDGNDDKSTE